MSELDKELDDLQKQLDELYAELEKDIEAAKCPHCQGGVVWTEAMEEKRERHAELGRIRNRAEAAKAAKWPPYAEMTKVQKLEQALEYGLITKEEKELACGSSRLFDAKIYAHYLNTNVEFWGSLKKVIGRSFTATVREENNEVILKVSEQIHDGEYWLTHDVAQELQKKDSEVQDMCEFKYRSKRTREDRLPWHKDAEDAKSNFFYRREIRDWMRRDDPCECGSRKRFKFCCMVIVDEPFDNPKLNAIDAARGAVGARNGKRKR